MNTSIAAGSLLAALTLVAPLHGQQVSAGVVVRSGPVAGHVVIGDGYSTYRRPVVVYRRAPARVIVIERVYRRQVHDRHWRKHYRPVRLVSWLVVGLVSAAGVFVGLNTLALATEATLFSVAGSITSKRAPSEALRHLPPIHRSVGTLASRLSYMGMDTLHVLRSCPRKRASSSWPWVPAFAAPDERKS